MSFAKYIHSCNFYHSQDKEYFYHPQDFSHSSFQLIFLPPASFTILNFLYFISFLNQKVTYAFEIGKYNIIDFLKC